MNDMSDFNFKNVRNALIDAKGKNRTRQPTYILSIGPAAAGFFDKEKTQRRYQMRVSIGKMVMDFLKIKPGEFIELRCDEEAGKGLLSKTVDPKDGFKLSGSTGAKKVTVAMFRYCIEEGVSPVINEPTECENIEYTHMGVVFDLPKGTRFDMGAEKFAEWVATGSAGFTSVKRKRKR